jgi:ABC-type transport system substrate-binding protein
MDWMKNNMVGTGPFKVKSWQQDVSLVVERNPDYWQPGKPYLDSVEILCISDPVTAQATILAGDADILQTEADQKVNDLTAKGLKAVTRTVGVANMFPDSKNASSPLSNQKVRMAIEYALDKESMSKTLCGGLVSPAYQMAPPNVPGHNPAITGYKYDPAKAKQLLTEAGFPNGVQFTIYPCPVPMFNDMAVAIQADLAKVGIQGKVETITDAKFGQLVTQASENAMILAAVSSCVPNWVQALSLFFNPKGILFPSMLRSDSYTATYMDAANTKSYDNAKAQALLKKIYDDEMVIPLFNTQEAWVYQTYVKDAWTVWPAGLQMWSAADAWLDK